MAASRKCVDVGLVVRMLTEANENTELVVVSSDTDLVPAFKAAGKSGAKLMHIGYENRPITALSQLSDTTRTITIPLIQKYNSRFSLLLPPRRRRLALSSAMI